MGMNFPNTPSVGDLYPTPVVAGLPQYRWDGEKWVLAVSLPTADYVLKAGDTMTGPLYMNMPGSASVFYAGNDDDFFQFQARNKVNNDLGGALVLLGAHYAGAAGPAGAIQIYAGANPSYKMSQFTPSGTLTLNAGPTNAMDAATKQYVDSKAAGIADAPSDSKSYGRLNAAWSQVLPISGGTLTGGLSGTTANFTSTLTVQGGATFTGANVNLSAAGPSFIINETNGSLPASLRFSRTNNLRWMLTETDSESGSNSGSNLYLQAINDSGGSVGYALTATRATGLITLIGDPTANLGAATKQYVDNNAIGAQALAYNAIQINGGMEVSQESGTGVISVANATKFINDGWKVSSVGAQVMNSYLTGNTPQGFTHGLIAQVTTPNTSPAAGDYCVISQAIEGERITALGWPSMTGLPLSIGFWFSGTRVGTYSGVVQSAAGNQAYPFTFSNSTTNTFEYKTITIPRTAGGTWKVDNTAALIFSISLMCGTTYQKPANAWVNAVCYGATGAMNCLQAVNDFIIIGGVFIIPGNALPSAANLPYALRSTDVEWNVCQRYYRKIMPEGAGVTNSTTACYFSVMHSGMRATPAYGLDGVVSITDIVASNYTQSSANLALTYGSPNYALLNVGNFTGLTAGRLYLWAPHINATNIVLDARL